jgi:hypothetical protein
MNKFTTVQPPKATLFVLTIVRLPVIFFTIEGLMEACFSFDVGRSMLDVRRSFIRP